MLLVWPAAAAATTLPSTISENTTLTAEGSPYTGSSVTIESGVTVKAEPGVNVVVGALSVKGTLKAEGSAEAPVVFRPATEAETWSGLVFKAGSSASVLDRVEVRRAGGSWEYAIRINESSPTITHSTIRESTYFGIFVAGASSPEIADDAIIGAGGIGIYYGETEGKAQEVNFHDNLVEKVGGSAAIFVEATEKTVATSLGDNTVTKNSTTQAIYYNGGSSAEIPPDIANNLVSGNTGGASTNQVQFSGILKKSATWESPTAPLYMGSKFKVSSGITLTLKPGVAIHSGSLEVLGTLKAEGSAEAPVSFLPAGEGGTWGGLVFKAGSSASVLDHVEVRGAGSGWGEAIRIDNSSPTITNSTIRESTYFGIFVAGASSPEIADNEIIGAGGIGIYYGETEGKAQEIDLHDNLVEKVGGGGAIFVEASEKTVATSLGDNIVTKNSTTQAIYYNGGSSAEIPPDIANNLVSGNTGGASTNQVQFSGILKKSATWEPPTPLLYIGNFKIASGITLTLKPGVAIHSGSLEVLGTLKAEGSTEAPVSFLPASEGGTWGGLVFKAGSSASVLDHVEVRGAGSGWGEAIKINNSSPTITHSTIRESTYYGVFVSGESSPEIADNEIIGAGGIGIYYGETAGKAQEVNFHDNLVEKVGGSAAIFVEPSSEEVASSLGDNIVTKNSTTQAIYYNGGSSAEIPPDIANNLVSGNTGGASTNQVQFSGILKKSATWESATAPLFGNIKVASGPTLTLKPGFAFYGGVEVVGTLKAEGTAEAPVFIGASSPSGYCDGIKFMPGSSSSVLDHAEIYRCGWISGSGAIEVKGSSPTITNSTIRGSSYYGIKVTESGAPKIEWNRFRGNTYGLSYSGSGKLSAPNNDWECASGPSPAGCGNSVSSNVNWEPAVPLPELAGHCWGKKSQCGEGADPVSLATGQLSYSHRDLLLTNKSVQPLEFTRSYTSGSSLDTGLGPGWSQTGLASAVELESGHVFVLRQDGRQDIFLKTKSGYKAPSGVTDTLAKVEGKFQLTTPERAVYRFDESGRIVSLTDDHGLKTTYGYNENGLLTTITDPSAQTLTFSYDGSNHITKVTDSTGREVKYTYSGSGDLATVTDALGGVTEYTYDSERRLKTIKDPRGNVILKNVYDRQGRIIEQRDGLENLWKLEYKEGETIVTEPEGGKTTYGFDGQDRVVSEKDQLGHTTTTSYDEAGNVDEIVKPGGAKWEFGHDPAGNLTSVVDPEGGERSYEYDGKNRLTSFTDARGNTWSYEWSEANNLEKVTDPAEGETTATYNASGQPLTVTDPDEHTTTFTYDTRGNRLTVEDALEHTTTLAYNSRNHLTSRTAPGLKAESFERNALGDLLAHTTPEGNKTKYAYDANGVPKQITDPAENVWKVERNAMERPTAYVDPPGKETKIEYDGNFNPVKVTDRRGKATTYAYDLANRVTGIQRPEGGDWEFDYDARGNRSEAIDPRENVTSYDYDLLDRMTEVAEPLEATTSYEYDPAGNLTSFTDPNESTTNLVYDELGRLTEIGQPLEKTTSFTYDGAGNQLTQTTAAGTVELDYDAANRLREVGDGESTLGSFEYDAANRMTDATDTQSDEIEIGYDDDGRVVSIDDGRGQTVSRKYDSRDNLTEQVDGRGTLKYKYDKLSRMTSLTDPQSKVLGFDYDPEGNLTEVELPNGVLTTNEYNNAGRLAETTSKKGETTLESLDYDYDPFGSRIGQVDRLSQETTYDYDALNRLIELDPPGEGSTSYDYDAAGNRTKVGATTYNFNALNQLTSASNGTTYDYDNAGRLVEVDPGETSTSYRWNVLDELTSVDTGAQEIDYAYDAFGRQVLRDDGSTIRPSHYGDLSDLPILDTDAEGEPTMSYVQGPEGLVEQRSGKATSFPLRDAHGDITTLADGEGKVASRQTYDPWGKQLTGPSLEMGWLGAQQRRSDPATGLVQMGARPYSPTLGSFASEDPVLGQIGLSVTADRYAYAWNNPLGIYDLDGRFPDPGDVAGAVGGAVDSGWDATAGGRSFAGIAGSGNGGTVGNVLEAGGDYTNHVANFWSDRYGDFVKNLKESCGTSFADRAADNFMVTNKAVPGLLAPTLSSIPINRWGGIAARYGTTGGLEWVLSSRNLAELPKVARAAGVSWLYASLAWEAGVGIGSVSRSALAELYC